MTTVISQRHSKLTSRPTLRGRHSSRTSAPQSHQLLLQSDLPTWTPEKEAPITAPYDYLCAFPGKDARGQLLAAFNIWFQIPMDQLAIIQRVVSMLHNSSLLIDDIQDNSDLRRGHPAAHIKYGTARTINAANYVYFQALAEVSKLDSEEAVKVFTEELLNLHRGQGLELFWRETLTVPHTEEYLEMVANKTGGLFRLAARLMELCSPRKAQYPAATRIATLLGVLFQIRDDFLNLQSDQYTNAKGFCDDLSEGKFSFPIIKAIRAKQTDHYLINVLRQRPTNIDVKQDAVAYMERLGSFSHTRDFLKQLESMIRGIIKEAGGNEGLTKLLDKMVV